MYQVLTQYALLFYNQHIVSRFEPRLHIARAMSFDLKQCFHSLSHFLGNYLVLTQINEHNCDNKLVLPTQEIINCSQIRTVGHAGAFF